MSIGGSIRVILVASGLVALAPLSGCAINPSQNAPAGPQTQVVVAAGVHAQRAIPRSTSAPGNPATVGTQNEPRPVLAPPMPTEPSTVWQALAEGFSLSAPENCPRLAQARRYWLRDRAALTTILQRSRPYIGFIAEQVRVAGAPMELALLPAVESGFRPRARSHKRAAGLWQFIPATGRRFGLQQSWWYDGRLDVANSTAASLKFLNSLAARYQGDWLLALAAYNAGPGRINRALRARPEANFWRLDLPGETDRYVPRLLALAEIIAAPEQYGVVLPDIAPDNTLVVLDTGNQIDLSVLSRHSGVPLETLQTLNPGVLRWASDPDGPHQLLVPAADAQRLKIAIAEVPAAERLRWVRYRIAQGDTLSVIAQRHGVSMAVIQRANQMADTRIRSGRHLLIPQGDPSTITKAATAPPAADTPAQAQRYKVRAGDSLWRIAKRHGTSVKALQISNGIKASTVLRPGQVLTVAKADAQSPKQQTRYRVRKGDSLWTIARRFDTTVDRLRQHNALNRALLRPGQILQLPLDS